MRFVLAIFSSGFASSRIRSAILPFSTVPRIFDRPRNSAGLMGRGLQCLQRRQTGLHHEAKLIMKAESRKTEGVSSVGSRQKLYTSAVHCTHHLHLFLEEALSAGDDRRMGRLTCIHLRSPLVGDGFWDVFEARVVRCLEFLEVRPGIPNGQRGDLPGSWRIAQREPKLLRDRMYRPFDY